MGSDLFAVLLSPLGLRGPMGLAVPDQMATAGARSAERVDYNTAGLESKTEET